MAKWGVAHQLQGDGDCADCVWNKEASRRLESLDPADYIAFYPRGRATVHGSDEFFKIVSLG